jgi:endonuclease/exonuclease/phosphatase family metal-dependent hydrolase
MKFGGMKARIISSLVLVCITFGTIIGAFLTMASPPLTTPGASMKVMTYNIQQGYNEFGEWAFDAQLDVIRAEDPDILALQESDIARISGGNADIVRFIADRLDLYSYYGPKVVVGTFGLALLAKYPIENATTFYVYSEGEQIACVQAEVRVGATTYNLFVAHPAGPGRVTQQQQMLSRITGKSDVIFLGDFNLEPYEEAYNITVAGLNDSWEIANSQITGDLPVNWASRFPSGRIDHIFVSSGTMILSCKYFGGSSSDHPAALVEIQL